MLALRDFWHSGQSSGGLPSSSGRAAGAHSAMQWGNRRYRSTRDALFVAHVLLEELMRVERPPESHTLWFLPLDTMKAFPSVPRAFLREVLMRMALPPFLVDLVMGLHDETKYVVRTAAGDSSPYSFRS